MKLQFFKINVQSIFAESAETFSELTKCAMSGGFTLGKITFDGLPTLFVPSQISRCSKPGPSNPILSPEGEPDSL